MNKVLISSKLPAFLKYEEEKNRVSDENFEIQGKISKFYGKKGSFYSDFYNLRQLFPKS